MNTANEQMDRREFLKKASQVAALALGAAGPRTWLTGAEPDASGAIQIGILLGTFQRGTLEARLDAVKACGLDCIQVSLDCAGLSDLPDAVPPEVASRIRRETSARGIAIASVQGTFNMSHPDTEYRKTGLRRLRVLAEACPQLGASKIHLCTGTRDRGSMWRRHPDNHSVCIPAAPPSVPGAAVAARFERSAGARLRGVPAGEADGIHSDTPNSRCEVARGNHALEGTPGTEADRRHCE
jgi:hypothetical protein